MRLSKIVIAALLALALAPASQAATLLDAAGQPVGGQWQAWLDQSQELTYGGSMTLDVSSSVVCPGGYYALGCTSDYGFTGDTANSWLPETAIDLSALPAYSYEPFSTSQLEQWVLLYEQGHVVDMEYLTDGERAELLADWGVTVPAGETIDQFWWQNVGDEADQKPVMGEWFAAAYSICALYGRRLTWQQVQFAGQLIPTAGSPLVDGLPILQAAADPSNETPADATALHVQLETCALIGTLAPRL